jgi:spore maturation protein SpmB
MWGIRERCMVMLSEGEAPPGEPAAIKRVVLSLRRGGVSGIFTSWTLLKVMIPTMVLVQLLKVTGLLGSIASMGAPLMGLFGLPGESSLVLITGGLVNIYAAIAVAVNIPLTAKGMTILAIMVLIAHNLIVETAVQSQSGTPAWITLPVRLTAAVFAGLLFAWIIPGGGRVIVQALTPAGAVTWNRVLLANGISLAKIIVIILSLMVVMELSREFGLMDRITGLLSLPMKFLGMDRRTSLVTAVGLLLGLAYGAGLIIDETRRSNIGKAEILATNIFLGTNHALIEDTLIFVAVGASLGWILLGRLIIGYVILRVSLPVVLYFWQPDSLTAD